MKIDIFELGVFETNCYVLRANELARNCIIIDAGLDAEPLLEFLKQNLITPDALLLTHGHADHIAGAELLKQAYPDIKVAIHRLDSEMLTDSMANLSAVFGFPFETNPADVFIDDQSFIDFAGIKFEVLHTPGHTPGGISFYCESERVVFSGDALFAGGVGRTDFPGGSHSTLIYGIKKQLLTLLGDTKVYPGHGPSTTIKTEQRYNQYLR